MSSGACYSIQHFFVNYGEEMGEEEEEKEVVVVVVVVVVDVAIIHSPNDHW